MKALITGVNGQDGAYLTKHLLKKGYDVIGVSRKNLTDNLDKLNVRPHHSYFGDVSESDFMNMVIWKEKPDEIYNLAAQSHVGVSFNNPISTMNVNYSGLVNIINAVKKYCPKTKIYQASTSEMFGGSPHPLNEESPFIPKSPYAIAKLSAHWSGINARKEGIWVSNGILFNHESPLRGEDFVTRKITLGVARILRGENQVIELGNINSQRDWGFAGDYVKAMHLMLRHDKPDDFVIGTGEAWAVTDFLYMALAKSGKEIEIKGTGENETWYANGKLVMRINPKFYRPNEVDCLIADPSKAKEVLGWRPEVSFEKLVERMVGNDR